MYCIACNSAHRLSKPCPSRLRHTYHQNPAARRLAIQQNLTQPLDIRRIADALEALATSIQTLVRINGLGELGFIERPGGPLAGGGALAEPGVSDTLSGPLSDQPRATYTPPACARLSMNTGTCGKLSSEIDTLKQTATKKKTVRKRLTDTSFPRLGAPEEELLSFLAKWEIDAEDAHYTKFSLYYQSTGKMMRDWKATWRAWKERQSEWNAQRGGPPEPPKPKELPEWIRKHVK